MIYVIVPVYKTEQYLGKCVYSILQQTGAELSVVLVDDGSPDHAGALCDRLAQENETVTVVHKPNGGLSSARNAGLELLAREGKLTQGNFVAFADSDDTVENGIYSTLLELIRNVDGDIALCECRRVLPGETLTRVDPAAYPAQTLTREALWTLEVDRMNNAAVNKLYKGELLQELRFPEGIIHGEDMIFNLQYLLRCKAGVYTKAPFYNYYYRQDSITNAPFSQSAFLEITAKDTVRQLLAEHYPSKLPQGLCLSFRARMNVAREMLRHGKEREYEAQLQQIKDFLKTAYPQIRHLLRPKERIEYGLFRSGMPAVYRIALGLFARK